MCSGDPTPTQADIQMTKEIVSVAQPLGIAVHDHIIVGKDGHALQLSARGRPLRQRTAERHGKIEALACGLPKRPVEPAAPTALKIQSGGNETVSRTAI
jgi:hypothetical protein